MNKALFKREIKANWMIWVIFIAVISLYKSMVIAIYDPQTNELMDKFAEMMPELMAAVGMINGGSTLLDFIASYLYGMLLLIFPLLLEIILSNRLVSRYIDRGSMAYLLSTPVSRLKIVTTQASILLLSLVFMMGFMIGFGTLCSQIIFPGELNVAKYALLNVEWLFLQFAICGICFLASAVCNDSKHAYMFGAGIPIAFYIIKMIANLGKDFEAFRYFTIYTLFDTNKIISGESTLWQCITLITIGIVCFAIAIVRFVKRDLSL